MLLYEKLLLLNDQENFKTLLSNEIDSFIKKQYQPSCTIYRTDACWDDWCSASVLKRNNIWSWSRVPFISLSISLLHIPRNRLKINYVEDLAYEILWFIITCHNTSWKEKDDQQKIPFD
jgi:hypothetical protein